MADKRDKFRGCILGLAVGDALGYPVEFIQTIQDIDAVSGGTLDLPSPALFSDDTQMSLCVIQALLECDGNHDKFMDGLSKYFVAWSKRQKPGSPDRRAPGNSCLAGCDNLAGGVHWTQSGVESKGCGSAMRSAPIGLYWSGNLLKVIEWGRDSSLPTHKSDAAMCSAAATAFMTFLAVNDVPVGLWAHEMSLPLSGISEEFTEAILKASQAAGERTEPWIALSGDGVGEGWLGHEAVASALYCAMMCPNDYAAAVRMAARTVGDSDSIACITGAIMGAHLGVKKMPKEWTDKIEARDRLFSMADKLYDQMPTDQSDAF